MTAVEPGGSLIVEPEVVPEPAPAPAPAEIPTGYYPEDYVKGLRQENQKYRETWSPFEQTFGGMTEEDREAYLQLARMHNEEDPNIRSQLAQTLGFQLPPDESPQYMTRQEFDAAIAERETQRQQQDSIENIYRQAEALGYQRNTEDMIRLTWRLTQMDEPDVKVADAAIKSERQKVIDDFMSKKQRQAETITQPDTDGVPGRPDMEIKNIKDSRKAAEARLAGLRGQ